MSNDEKIIVLTGASRGLGRELALDLAAAGTHLFLAARDREALEGVAAEVRERGGRATAVPADVTRAEDRERLIAAAEGAGPIAVLVNNAGIEIPVALLDHGDEDVERQVAVNLLGTIHLTRRALPAMVERGGGTVVIVSSMSGKSPTPYNSVYAATKFGLTGFASSLRIELADTGVHVGTVCPSFVGGTGMWADSGVKAPALLREVPPAKVVAGVRKVLAGAPEMLVTPGPVRPLLALAQLFPRLDGRLLRWMGVLEKLRERARATAQRRGS